jgi:hypothetical protein
MKRARQLKSNKKYRKHLLYKRGEERIVKELDVIHMIRSNSLVWLMSKILLDNKQK